MSCRKPSGREPQRKEAQRDHRTDGHAAGQSRQGRAARQTGRCHRQEHAAALARRLGRTSAVDINALVEESLNLAYHGARAEKQGFNITLERSLDPAAGAADVFPQDITRALLNLILNSFYAATKRKAQANGGDYEPTLTAATKNLGDRVEISIRDNGTGIPPEVKEKIFNPFFTTKPAGEGTGLGLSISHDIIVKQHGGSIEVDTQPGEFTEIRVILPRVATFAALVIGQCPLFAQSGHPKLHRFRGTADIGGPGGHFKKWLNEATATPA